MKKSLMNLLKMEAWILILLIICVAYIAFVKEPLSFKHGLNLGAFTTIYSILFGLYINSGYSFKRMVIKPCNIDKSNVTKEE